MVGRNRSYALPGGNRQKFLLFSLQPRFYIATENTYTVKDLDPNKTYYWRIRPFNEYYTCATATPPKAFKTNDIATATNEIRHLND